MGFSTGALALGDFSRGLAMMEDKQASAIELSALRENELPPLIANLDKLNVSSYEYVSVHAPSKYGREQEPSIVRMLGQVANKGWRIVLHPDAIYEPSLWVSFGSMLLIENMDKRYSLGRTATELEEIFDKLPNAGLCFDIGHCRQVDPTMNESHLILIKYQERLTQLHVSDVNSRSTHDPLSSSSIDAFQKVAAFVPESIPVILESPVIEECIEKEILSARLALSVVVEERMTTTAADL